MSGARDDARGDSGAEYCPPSRRSAAIEQKAIAKQNAEYKKQTGTTRRQQRRGSRGPDLLIEPPPPPQPTAAIAEQKDGSCQVDIIGVTKVEDINKKPIHLYKVSSYFGTKSGLTQVRYSQFKTLRENMIKWLNIKGRQNLIENVPPLPPAKLKLFKEHDSAFIQERRSGLQTFLKNVMRLPKIIECEALRRFLEI